MRNASYRQSPSARSRLARLVGLGVCLLAGSTGVAAADAPKAVEPVQLRAAVASARAELRQQILSIQLAHNLTVGALAESGSDLSINEIVGSAEQVGGVRTVDHDIVEVMLSVPASTIIGRVSRLPEAGRDARLTPRTIKDLQRQWNGRSVQAVGQGIPPQSLPSLLSVPRTPAWREVPLDARLDTEARARKSAAETLARLATALTLEKGRTVAQNSTTPNAAAEISQWALSLPLTRLILREDRQIEVGLYVDKAGLSTKLQEVVSTEVMARPGAQKSLSDGIAALPSIVIGRASLSAGGGWNDQRPANPLPLAELPDWLSTPLSAEGKAPSMGSKLLTARAAEQAARTSLLAEIGQLTIGDTTLSDASAKDKSVAAAATRAADRARVYQVHYAADGSVKVKITLDPTIVLDELADDK